jgi:putative ABC transport system permease protein
MWRLALRTLRFRKAGFVATFVALLFGTAIVMACGGLMETGIRNNVPPQRLAEAAVVVSGDRTYELPKADRGDPQDAEAVVLPERVPLGASLVEKVDDVPGVSHAVGDLSFPVALVRDGRTVGGDVLGHGWDSAPLTPYELHAGAAPDGPGQVVLDATVARAWKVAVGDRVGIAAHGGVGDYTVSGIANSQVEQAAVFFSAADARRLAGRGKVAAIAVLADPGADKGELRDRIAAALKGQPVSVLTGDDRGFAEHPEALLHREDLIALAGVFGGLAVMVAMFVAAGTMALSAQQRQREIALLRAIGAAPRQLRRMLLGEMLVLTVLAAALAWPLGTWLGGWLFDRLASGGVTTSALRFSQGWIPAVVALGAVLLAGLGGGLLAARRVVRTRPTEALTEASLQQRWFSWIRLAAALLFLGGGAALAIVTMTVLNGPVAASTAGPTVICCAIGLALLSPGLTKMLTSLLQWPLRAVTGTAGRLAMLNARARAVQLAAVVTPVMLATGIAISNLYLQTTQTAAAERAFTENLRADAVLTSTGGLDPALLDRVRDIPGVGATGASAYASSTGFVERPYDGAQTEDGRPLLGVTAEGAERTTAIKPTEGSMSALRGETVALPAKTAQRLALNIGDFVTLRLGDRSVVRLRMVALFEPKAGYAPLLLPAELLAPHTTSGLPAQILVRAQPGSGGTELTGALQKLAARHPGVSVTDRHALIAAHTQDTKTQAWINYLLVGMIVAYTAISVVNTLAMATTNRRREFALQRLTGATKGQVLRMTAVEGTLVAAIGILLGTAVSTTTLVPFSLAVSDSPIPRGPLWIYLAVVGTTAALTLGATLLPAWSSLRVRPAKAVTAAAD